MVGNASPRGVWRIPEHLKLNLKLKYNLIKYSRD
jgi:hypothetical protein